MVVRFRALGRFILPAFLAAIAAVVASCTRESQSPIASSISIATQLSPGTGLEKDDLPEPRRLDITRSLGFHFAPAPTPAHKRSDEEMAANSVSCRACHLVTDSDTMHKTNQGLSCVDCHGGHADIVFPAGINVSSASYTRLKRAAHVVPTQTPPERFTSPTDPNAIGAESLQVDLDYIRFINPGDMRAAVVTCYTCHADQVKKVQKSMMAHGAMLWGAALYNNGAITRKNAVYGESYALDGTQQHILANPLPTTRQVDRNGQLTALWPLPRWEITRPGNVLRVFERGGERRPILGIPDTDEPPGRPDVKLSVRGFGTDVRTDPVFLGLQKTRLFDPTINLPGTNDHPGDYRASGCSACHVVYANDRSPVHSAQWARFGNRGTSASKDITVNKTEPGHPIQHAFVRDMPTSQCIVCHIHPGTNVVNSYLGYLWWDNESDGEFMYPSHQKYPTSEEEFTVSQHNPEGAAARGLWSNMYPNDQSHAGKTAGINFLENLTDLNPLLKHNQFADFHGHGWVFRGVFKRDRHGNLLNAQNEIIPTATAELYKQAVEYQSSSAPPTSQTPVHLKDIHLEKGMACADCHFSEDSHGDTHLYGETRNAIMVECIDCHGTADHESNILRYLKIDADPSGDKKLAQQLLKDAFTGNAATRDPAANLRIVQNRYALDDAGNRLVQKSMMYRERKPDAPASTVPEQWTVIQTHDTIAPPKDLGLSDQQLKLGRYAHTIRRDNKTWGDVPAADNKDAGLALAHPSDTVSCYACHTSWNTSCFGCHLPMKANQNKPMLHNEGTCTRNYTNYNYQTIRDDMFMLGVDSTVKKNKVVPVRSACAVMVSSQDANRQWIYAQQQTVSAEGFAGTAFSPYYPHTVRATETRQCADCHISKDKDNNAIMAQLLMQGTNAVNFVGRFAWVGLGEGGLEAVAVTERDEPQAVIGSRLHELAFPDYFRKHQEHGLRLAESHEHAGTVLDLQLRGEYLYAACGADGFVAYDVSAVDNKGFSERIITAPVSSLGQRFFVKTSYATSVCSPSTMALDPTRDHLPANQEGKVHLLYAYLYVTDRDEGLIVVGNQLTDRTNKAGVATLLDGDPDNNFLRRAATYNPQGLLRGARHIDLYGHFAFVSCDAGIVVLNLDNPTAPVHMFTLTQFKHPRKVAFQFRYGFVCDDEGVKVIDLMNLPGLLRDIPPEEKQQDLQLVKKAIPIPDARDIALSRTYGYVAAGRHGVVILDIEKPEESTIDRVFIADAAMKRAGDSITDATAIRIGMTNISMFAYVADGINGLRVLQLTSANTADETPGFMGYSPRPNPRQVAIYPTRHPAIAISKGLERDRAVDESGHQLSVFGRRGARPFNLEEQQKLYLNTVLGESVRKLYSVTNEPTPEMSEIKAATAGTETPATPTTTEPTGGHKFGRPKK